MEFQSTSVRTIQERTARVIAAGPKTRERQCLAQNSYVEKDKGPQMTIYSWRDRALSLI